MKKRWKLAALFFVGALLLSGCHGGADGGETDEPRTDAIAVSALSDYVIVYAEEELDEELLLALQGLRGKLRERFGVTVEITNDFVREGSETHRVRPHEILIGATNRPESQAVCAELKRDRDYTVCLRGEKLVVAGLSHESVLAAVAALQAALQAALPEEGATDFFRADMAVTHHGSYPAENVTLNGRALSDYAVICAKDVAAQALAEQITATVRERTGYLLVTISETEAADRPCLRIGETAVVPDLPAQGGYFAGSVGSDVVLCGSDTARLWRAVGILLDALREVSGSGAAISVANGAVTCENTAVTSMTYNLLVNNVTPERVERVLTVIRAHQPDTLGVQEASEAWMSALREGLGEDYASVGIGRDAGGKGETSAIFYRKALFDVVESGTKWLTDTPDTVSRVDGSICNRVFTYAVLRRKSDGASFLCVNTHTDHAADPSVRLAQVRALTAFLATKRELPMVISGDFNEIATEPSIRLMVEQGYTVASEIALQAERKPTFKSSVIDYFFVTAERVAVFTYAVDDRLIDGEEPSDHDPIIITYELSD